MSYAPLACFLITATNRHRVKLRRFTTSGTRPCPARGEWGHDASTVVGEVVAAEHPPNGDNSAAYPHDDPRWPSKCAHCDAPFAEGDAHQVFHEQVYVRADGQPGDYFTRELPPGAMYDAPWLLELPDHRGPDGRSLILRLPDGRDWCIDGPSSNGNGWSRTGEPPKVTARPSILTHNANGSESYHGWLTDGMLVPC